jgi:hypothetical protein
MQDATEYLKLAKAIQDAPYAPPCMVTDPELWYPSHDEDYTPRIAKKFCEDCPVRQQCLEYALKVNEQYGVWGGLSVKERQALQAKGRNRRSPGRPSRSLRHD